MKKILQTTHTPVFISLKTGNTLPSLCTTLDNELFVKDVVLFQSNEQNFVRMYEDNNKQLYRYCFYRVSSADKALDIVQETFQRAWQYLEKGNTIYDKSFLYTTARHLIIDEYRKKKCVSLELLIGTELEPTVMSEDAMYTQVDIRYIMKHINQLPATYSDVLLMRYIDDCPISKIAKSLNISESAVSVRIFRGLGKLRILIHR